MVRLFFLILWSNEQASNNGTCTGPRLIIQFTAFPASATGAQSSSAPIQGSATLAPWPPAVISPFITAAAQVSLMPRLTQTGQPITMPTAAHPANVTVGNGWAFPSDTVGAYVTILGCNYPK